MLTAGDPPDPARLKACPDADALAEFVAGSASDDAGEAIESHIDTCERCAETVGLYAGAFDDRSKIPDAAQSLIGPQIPTDRFAGRYTILQCVGFGAGGTVYRAHDPELDRVVALKVLRSGDGGSTEADARWPREAKVMARVVHRNVVTVHDVGVADGNVFIATEFVEGSTLDLWITETAPDWRQALAAFLQAGRGLEAIHACGLVHRDFKPSNVMVGRAASGVEVRVTDFGLARRLPDLEEYDATATAETQGVASMLAETLTSRTATGTMVGTPAYMSPEQWRGEPADARSDQFSFCIALYEALFGCRPFRGRSAAELSDDVCTGTPRKPPRGAVPRWLAKIVLRGLAQRPEDRFEDMPSLLVALETAPRKVTRRRRVAGLVAGFIGVAGVGYGVASFDSPSCQPDDARFAGVWDAETKLAIDKRLEASGPVIDALDTWSARWLETSAAACRAARKSGSSPRQYELQLACLDRRLSELGAAASVLASGDAPEAGAVEVVSTISMPDRCADVSTLEMVEPSWSSPETRLLALELSEQLDRVEALRAAGKLDAAQAIAERTVERANQSGDPAVRAEALVGLGEVLSTAKRPTEAESALRDGVWAAEASGHVEMAAAGWIELVNVLGAQREDYDAAMEAGDRAAAAVHRLQDPERAVALGSNLAVLQSMQGHYKEALRRHREVLAQALELYGEDDPQIGRMHINIAAVLSHMGRPAEALEQANTAVAIQEARFAGPHPLTAEMLNSVAALHMQLGDLGSSRAAFERALVMAEQTLPARSITIAMLLANVAQVDQAEKDFNAAAERYVRVISIYKEIHGGPHPDIALALHNYASVIDDQGDKERAIVLYREALQMRIDTNGPEHPGTANTMHNLGLCLFGHGAIDEGIELMERARKLRDRAGVDPFRRASSNFMLARAYDKKGETAKALEHAKVAADHLRSIAPRKADLLDHIEQWIDDRQG